MESRVIGPSDHRLIAPSEDYSVLRRWTDGPMNRGADLGPGFAPIFAKSVYFLQKDRWIPVHFRKNDVNQAQKPE